MPLWIVRSIQDSWNIETLSSAEFEQRIRQRGVFRDPARNQAATEDEINRLLQFYWDFRINARRRKTPEDYIFGLEASPNHAIPLSDHRFETAVHGRAQDAIVSDAETLSVLGIEWGQLGNYAGPVLRMRSSFVALKTPMRRLILTERHLSDSSGLYVTIGSVLNPARTADGRRGDTPEQRRKDVVAQVRWILEHHNLYKLYYYPDPTIANDYMHPQHLVRRGGDNGGGGFKLLEALNNYRGLNWDRDTKQLVPGQRRRVRRLREVLNWYMADPRRIADLEEFEMVTLLVEEMFGTMSDYGPIPTDHPDFSTAPIPHDENYRVLTDLTINAMWTGVEMVANKTFTRRYFAGVLSRKNVLDALLEDRLYFHNYQLIDSNTGTEVVRASDEAEDSFRRRYPLILRFPDQVRHAERWLELTDLLVWRDAAIKALPNPGKVMWGYQYRDAASDVGKGFGSLYGTREQQVDRIVSLLMFGIIHDVFGYLRGVQEAYSVVPMLFNEDRRIFEEMLKKALLDRSFYLQIYKQGFRSKYGVVDLGELTPEDVIGHPKMQLLFLAVETGGDLEKAKAELARREGNLASIDDEEEEPWIVKKAKRFRDRVSGRAIRRVLVRDRKVLYGLLFGWYKEILEGLEHPDLTDPENQNKKMSLYDWLFTYGLNQNRLPELTVGEEV